MAAVGLTFAAVTIGLIVASVAAFIGRAAGPWAVMLLGLAIPVLSFSGRVYPADLWVAGAAGAAGLAGLALRVLRSRPGDGVVVVRGLLRAAAGLIGLGLAVVAAALAVFGLVGIA
jgi:hypothetical protein